MTALVAVALKGLVVVLAATLVTRLLRRSSASARHSVWVAAFVALLLLPVLEMAGPRWAVGVLPASETSLAFVGSPMAPLPPPPPPAFHTASPPSAPASRSEWEAYEREMAAFEVEMEAFDHEMEAFMTEQQNAEHAIASFHRQAPTAHLGHGGLWRGWRHTAGRWLLGVWAVGALAVGLGWLAAVLAARRIVAGAEPESDPEWGVLAERARRLAGLAAPVRLLRSSALDVPVAWGWGGAVVLPTDADAWDEDRREAVLLHEMAHLARRDAWSQAAAQAALAVHWANPLAWWAYRQFLDAREQACDDAVIRGGARPSAYAAHLVGVARAIRRDRLALAAVAPMARTAPIEGRVVSILDEGRDRGCAGRRVVTATAALGVAVLVPLAAFQPVAQTPLAGPPMPDWTAVADTLDALYDRQDTDGVWDGAVDGMEDAWDDLDQPMEDVGWDDLDQEMDEATDDMAEETSDEMDDAFDQADDDIAQARRDIRRAIAGLEREGGPRADLRIQALRQAEAGLAEIDRDALREQARRALDAEHAAGDSGWRAPPTPHAPPVPPSRH